MPSDELEEQYFEEMAEEMDYIDELILEERMQELADVEEWIW